MNQELRMEMLQKPTISIIAAIGSNRELGKDNKLLWHIPEDLKRFRQITSGHPVIMGRNTYQSIGKPLPKRTNIIITRDPQFSVEGCLIVHSLNKAIQKASETDTKEIFIIGGGQIYSQAICIADKLYLTKVEGSFDADTFFPDYSRFHHKISQTERKDEKYKYIFLELKA